MSGLIYAVLFESVLSQTVYLSSLQWSVESNSRLLWFRFTTLCDWLKNSRHFFDQSEAKLKPIVTCSHAFSRAWRKIYAFASSSDWFIALFASVVIGQSNSFGFGLNTLMLKIALKLD